MGVEAVAVVEFDAERDAPGDQPPRDGERQTQDRRDHERERERLPAEAATESNGAVKLFVNRGKRSGIGEKELRWALTEGAVIPDGEIGSIRVLERFSFVELPDEQAKIALERLDGTKLEGKQIRVEYAKD